MASKTANLYARIKPEVKARAEDILNALGVPVSSAINMFYKQIILQRGIPFELKMPTSLPIDMSLMTKAELDAEIEKGYDEVLAGKCKPAKDVFDSIRKDYNL